jgi:hypothetical protein
MMEHRRNVSLATRKGVWTAFCVVVCLGLAACEEDPDPNAQGGGRGSSTPANGQTGNVVQPLNDPGFCGPQGGEGALGPAVYASNSPAKIDTDGDPSAQGQDATWNPHTAGKVNGQDVNSARYAYVVMSEDQMAANGVSLGDWALVTNRQTGQRAWARVEDVGPSGGTGEISEAAASAVGIQYVGNSNTVGNPSVTVQAYANTASLGGDCSNSPG